MKRLFSYACIAVTIGCFVVVVTHRPVRSTPVPLACKIARESGVDSAREYLEANARQETEGLDGQDTALVLGRWSDDARAMCPEVWP